MNEQLSVTTWPGYPVPVPDIPRYPEATLDGEIIWVNPLGLHGEMTPPPPELYLRQARQVDLDDPHALLDFVRNVGGVPLAFEDRDLWPPGGGSKDDRADFAVHRNRNYVEPQRDAGRGHGVHVDEVAYRLQILDILGRHAVAYRRGNYLAPVWQEAFVALVGPGKPPGVWTEDAAWRWFGYLADPALQIFHVRVQAFADYGHGIRDVTGATRRTGPTFLEVGVLQIVNDLADEVDYLNCPNCGRVFARQVGGSTHYSRRTGVTYCSPSCATAARVKAYRARKRTERKQ
jgi:predicted RNA-binding Zn-ribbon protein involved in translation (DUF1610 family)